MTPAIIEAARSLLEHDLSEAGKIVNAMREGRTNSIGLTDEALRKFNRTYKPPRNR